jgi:hypothetical protein
MIFPVALLYSWLVVVVFVSHLPSSFTAPSSVVCSWAELFTAAQSFREGKKCRKAHSRRGKGAASEEKEKGGWIYMERKVYEKLVCRPNTD